jgi:hypothetical protein
MKEASGKVRGPTDNVNFRIANRTRQNVFGAANKSVALKLQYGFDAALVAGCTYTMKCFGWLSIWFQRVSERWATTNQLLKLIPLLLSFPCFKASHFFFKLAYAIQQRRLSRLGRYCALHGGKDFSVQFPERIPEFDEVAGLYQFLQSLARRVQGGHNVV